MSKLASRIVAFLLVPCLTVDPALAVNLWSFPSHGSGVFQQPSFQDQALAAEPVGVPRRNQELDAAIRAESLLKVLPPPATPADKKKAGSFDLTRPVTDRTLDAWSLQGNPWERWLARHRRLGIVAIEQLGLPTVALDSHEEVIFEDRWLVSQGEVVTQPRYESFLYTFGSGRLPGLLLLAVSISLRSGSIGWAAIGFLWAAYIAHQAQFVEDHDNRQHPVAQRLIRSILTLAFNAAVLVPAFIAHQLPSGHASHEVLVFAFASISGLMLAGLIQLVWNVKAPWWLQMTRNEMNEKGSDPTKNEKGSDPTGELNASPVPEQKPPAAPDPKMIDRRRLIKLGGVFAPFAGILAWQYFRTRHNSNPVTNTPTKSDKPSLALKPGEHPFDRDRRVLIEAIEIEGNFESTIANLKLPPSFDLTLDEIREGVKALRALITDKNVPIEYITPGSGPLFAVTHGDRTIFYIDSSHFDDLVSSKREALLHEAVHLAKSQENRVREVQSKSGNQIMKGLIPYFDKPKIAAIRKALADPKNQNPRQPTTLNDATIIANGLWDPDAFRKNPQLKNEAYTYLRAKAWTELEAWYVQLAYRVLKSPAGVSTGNLEALLRPFAGSQSVDDYVDEAMNRGFRKIPAEANLLIEEYAMARNFQIGTLSENFQNQFISMVILGDPQMQAIVSALLKTEYPNFDLDKIHHPAGNEVYVKRFFDWARPAFLPQATRTKALLDHRPRDPHELDLAKKGSDPTGGLNASRVPEQAPPAAPAGGGAGFDKLKINAYREDGGIPDPSRPRFIDRRWNYVGNGDSEPPAAPEAGESATPRYTIKEGVDYLKRLVQQKVQEHPDRPLVVLVEGMPGSGKSTFARRLEESDARVVHIDIDNVFFERTRWEFFDQALEKAKQTSGVRVIVLEGYASYLAEEHGIHPDVKVLIEADRETRRNNLILRESEDMSEVQKASFQNDIEGLLNFSKVPPVSYFDLVLTNNGSEHISRTVPLTLLDAAESLFALDVNAGQAVELRYIPASSLDYQGMTRALESLRTLEESLGYELRAVSLIEHVLSHGPWQEPPEGKWLAELQRIRFVLGPDGSVEGLVDFYRDGMIAFVVVRPENRRNVGSGRKYKYIGSGLFVAAVNERLQQGDEIIGIAEPTTERTDIAGLPLVQRFWPGATPPDKNGNVYLSREVAQTGVESYRHWLIAALPTLPKPVTPAGGGAGFGKLNIVATPIDGEMPRDPSRLRSPWSRYGYVTNGDWEEKAIGRYSGTRATLAAYLKETLFDRRNFRAIDVQYAAITGLGILFENSPNVDRKTFEKATRRFSRGHTAQLATQYLMKFEANNGHPFQNWLKTHLARIEKSIVRLIKQDGGGSGFIVEQIQEDAEYSYVLTNSHVVNSLDPYVHVMLFDGDRSYSEQGKVIARHSAYKSAAYCDDVALIAIRKVGIQPLSLASQGSRRFLAKPIAPVSGHHREVRSTGFVFGVHDDFLRVSHPTKGWVKPGDSGSPLIARDGKNRPVVIGVIFGETGSVISLTPAGQQRLWKLMSHAGSWDMKSSAEFITPDMKLLQRALKAIGYRAPAAPAGGGVGFDKPKINAYNEDGGIPEPSRSKIIDRRWNYVGNGDSEPPAAAPGRGSVYDPAEMISREEMTIIAASAVNAVDQALNTLVPYLREATKNTVRALMNKYFEGSDVTTADLFASIVQHLKDPPGASVVGMVMAVLTQLETARMRGEEQPSPPPTASAEESEIAKQFPSRIFTDKQTATLIYLIQIGVMRIGHVVDAFPPVLDLRLDAKIKPTVAYLQELGLMRIGHVIDTAPSVLGLSLEANIKPTVAYLQELGVTRIGHVVDTFPALLGLSVNANIKPTVGYLQELGVTRIGHVVDRFPAVLGLSVKANIKPTVGYLQELGVTRIGHVIEKAPNVLGFSLEDKIKPTVAYLKGLGVKRIGHVIDVSPPVLSYSLEANIEPTVAYLQKLGVTRIGHVVDALPTVLGLSVEVNIKPTVAYLKGLGVKRIGHVIDVAPTILSYSLEAKIKPTVVFLQVLGIMSIGHIIDSFPAVLTYSLKASIMPTVAYLQELGVQGVDHLVDAFPQVLGLSLETKLYPTVLVLERIRGDSVVEMKELKKLLMRNARVLALLWEEVVIGQVLVSDVKTFDNFYNAVDKAMKQAKGQTAARYLKNANKLDKNQGDAAEENIRESARTYLRHKYPAGPAKESQGPIAHLDFNETRENWRDPRRGSHFEQDYQHRLNERAEHQRLTHQKASGPIAYVDPENAPPAAAAGPNKTEARLRRSGWDNQRQEELARFMREAHGINFYALGYLSRNAVHRILKLREMHNGFQEMALSEILNRIEPFDLQSDLFRGCLKELDRSLPLLTHTQEEQLLEHLLHSPSAKIRDLVGDVRRRNFPADLLPTQVRILDRIEREWVKAIGKIQKGTVPQPTNLMGLADILKPAFPFVDVIRLLLESPIFQERLALLAAALEALPPSQIARAA